jgi:hypothetical protein
MNGAYKTHQQQAVTAAYQPVLEPAKQAVAKPTFAAELLPPAKTGHLGLCPVPSGPGLSPGCATQAHCLQATAPPCLQGQERFQPSIMFVLGACCDQDDTRKSCCTVSAQRVTELEVHTPTASSRSKVELLTQAAIARSTHICTEG